MSFPCARECARVRNIFQVFQFILYLKLDWVYIVFACKDSLHNILTRDLKEESDDINFMSSGMIFHIFLTQYTQRFTATVLCVVYFQNQIPHSSYDMYIPFCYKLCYGAW